MQHNLAFNKPFPMCMAKTDGAYLYDHDGNRYIDFLQAGGPTILGSNYPAVREKVIELLNTCGPVTGTAPRIRDDDRERDQRSICLMWKCSVCWVPERSR